MDGVRGCCRHGLPLRILPPLHGMDGAVATLQAYQLLLEASVARFPFPKLALSGCQRDWPDCHARIREFLRLEPGPTPGRLDEGGSYTPGRRRPRPAGPGRDVGGPVISGAPGPGAFHRGRSEEHTSELQSLRHI